MGNLADFVELKHWDMNVVLPNLELEKMTSLRYVKIEGDNGDALMHPDIFTLLDAIMVAPSKPNVKILTNGGMRNPKWWREFGARYKNRLVVQFSIDGLSDTNSLYRVDIDHVRVLKNVQAFVQGGGEAIQRCLVFKHNQHQIAEIVSQARSLGIKSLIFIPNDRARFQEFSQWAVYDKNYQISHYIENTDYDNLESEHLIRQKLSRFNYNESTVPLYENIVIRIEDEVCPVWRSGQLSITYKGHVIPCCDYHADLYFDHPNNDSFREMVGPVDLNDVNLHKLSDILDPGRFYGQRLTQSLKENRALSRCKSRCPNVTGGKPIIPILAIN